MTSTNNIPIRGKLSINWKFNSHILKIKKENTCKCKLLMALVTRVIPKMGITLMIMQSFVKPHTEFSRPPASCARSEEQRILASVNSLKRFLEPAQKSLIVAQIN